MAKKKKKKSVSDSPMVKFKPSLRVDSSHSKGMENAKLGQNVGLTVRGKVTGMRVKDDYEKGSGNIYDVEISSISRTSRTKAQIKNKKLKPRTGIKR